MREKHGSPTPTRLLSGVRRLRSDTTVCTHAASAAAGDRRLCTDCAQSVCSSAVRAGADSAFTHGGTRERRAHVSGQWTSAGAETLNALLTASRLVSSGAVLLSHVDL